jgi:acetylcholinesterase
MDVYYYKMSYVGRHSVFNYPRNFPYGMHHADDIQYVLNTWYVGPNIDENDPDNFMVERMTRLWEQFAWYGNPNNSSDGYLTDIVWPKFSTENEYHLDIGRFAIEKQGLFLDRFARWDRMLNSANEMKNLNSILIFSIFIALNLL